MKEIIPSAPGDRGQSVGPSAEDIAFFNDRSRISSPLKDTHGRNSSLARTATAAAVAFVPNAPGTVAFQAPNGEYCTIEFPPGKFDNFDPIGFSVDFNETSQPDSEHRVVLKNKFGQVLTSDHSKYRTDELEEGVELRSLSWGKYNLEVREKAVDFIFGDEGKSCEVELTICEEGCGPLDENGNVISPDTEIARIQSIGEVYSAFFTKYNGESIETNPATDPRIHPERTLDGTEFQCMDLLYLWADALGIPREAVQRQFAKDVFLSPNQLTRDFFEIIPYEEGMEIQLGDIGAWDEGVGNTAGHVAIATGEKNMYFSQNYPIEANLLDTKAHLQEIGTTGLKGILRARGFGPPKEPGRTKAPEKVDPKTRIEAILAVEPGDSVEMIGRKHFLSQWINALNLKRDAIDDNGNPTGKSLYISVTNLDSWLPNIRSLLNGERITNDPLKIAFIATDTMNGWDRLEGKGEMDDVSLDVAQWTEDDFTELEKKNGATPYAQYIGTLRFYERRQALYYSDYSSAETIDERPTIAEGLPAMSDWSKIVVIFDSSLYQGGVWENGPISVNGSYSVQGRWGDIRRVSDIYNIIYAHQFCYPEGEVGPGDKHYTGCVEIDS